RHIPQVAEHEPERDGRLVLLLHRLRGAPLRRRAAVRGKPRLHPGADPERGGDLRVDSPGRQDLRVPVARSRWGRSFGTQAASIRSPKPNTITARRVVTIG